MDPAEALRGFLDALGVPPARIPARPGGTDRAVPQPAGGKRVLVVLDNARDAAQVRPLLPGSPGCLAVVTSRQPADRPRRRRRRRPAGPGPAARRRGSRPARHAAWAATGPASDPGAVDEIIQRCARLPLALAIVAARAAARPSFRLADIAAELREASPVLDALEGDDLAADIRAVFSWSYHALARRRGAAVPAAGPAPRSRHHRPRRRQPRRHPAPQARRLLAELARAHLLTEHAPGRYAFHDLLRAYAAELGRHPRRAAGPATPQCTGSSTTTCTPPTTPRC